MTIFLRVALGFSLSILAFCRTGAEEPAEARADVTVFKIVDTITDDKVPKIKISFQSSNNATWLLSSDVPANGKVSFSFDAGKAYLKQLKDDLNRITRDSENRSGDSELPVVYPITVVVIATPDDEAVAFAISNKDLLVAFEANVLIKEVCREMLRSRTGKDMTFAAFLFSHLQQPTASYGFDTD